MSAEPQLRSTSPPPDMKPVAKCLSSEPHDISDHLLHYLGCLKYDERESLFDENHEIWKEEVKHYEEIEHNSTVSAEDRVRKKRETWTKDCKKELKRIGIVREAIKNDGRDCHLDEKIKESSQKWRDVKKCTAPASDPPTNNTSKADVYKLERDISIPIIQYELRGRRDNGAASSVDERGLEGETKPDERVWGDFPNQKTKLDLLWGEDSDINLLSQDRHPERIKYFHIPSNNMIWVENALARYFGEKRPDRHAIQRELKRAPKTRAYMLLRDPLWLGQFHGGERAPSHARHMRPICVTASSEVNDISPQNMVLFMPFLHWETSRQREKYARTIKETMESNKKMNHDNQEAMRQKRINARKAGSSGSSIPQSPLIPPNPEPRRPTFGDPARAVRAFADKKGVGLPAVVDELPVDVNRRRTIQHPLGQYILDAARLYEGMSNYRDNKLLEKYLGGETPLHPRRTLDQAYHWTLNTTKKRDRDQVIYRATTVPANEYHSYNREAKNWPNHEEFKITGDCAECRSRIRKISRVIMVDQLWMWVLDAKTIITCFPKRYGVNKHDSSGVHKSIRRRLEATPQIRTVFDLGLIIFDECSNVFFDRTKANAGQPPVIEIFSKAIGNVMHKQTAAFERLWNWTEMAGQVYRSKSAIASQLEVPLLDINPEGQLQREIKDIIEELDIMLHITTCHRTILKQYVENAENMLDPHGDYGQAHKKREAHKRGTSLSLYKKSLRGQTEPLKGMKQEESEESLHKKQDYHWFMLKADELGQLVEGRIIELKELRASAVSTAESVKDLLELKQQQAGVVQAWQAVNQANETIKQGRSIMMFTLVTIVFLPLSFMSSIFGMNNQEFSGDGWSLLSEIQLMFPISAVVILTSLFWAYSGWARDALWALYRRSTSWLVVKTGLFDLWLDIDKPKGKLVKEAARASEALFKNALEARYARKAQAAQEQEEKDKERDKEKTVKPSGHTPSPCATSRTMSAQETQEHQNGGFRDVDGDLESGIPPQSAPRETGGVGCMHAHEKQLQ